MMMDEMQIAPTVVSSHGRHSYVDWSAIFAGTVVAVAISFVATAFGSAIGLSMTSPYQGTNPQFFYPALGIWLVWITVSSFAAGGYITGRLRRRVGDAAQHEVDVRDGAHGLVMWSLAVVIGAMLAGLTTGAVMKSGANVVSKTIDAGLMAPQEQFVDTLLRGEGDVRQSVSVDEQTRRRVSGVVLRTPQGDFSADDHAYLASVISSSTGLDPDDASTRVDAVAKEMKANFEKEKALAEKARKAAVIIAFFAASTLAIGAATAFGATRLGGRHRDESFDLSHLVRTYRIR